MVMRSLRFVRSLEPLGAVLRRRELPTVSIFLTSRQKRLRAESLDYFVTVTLLTVNVLPIERWNSEIALFRSVRAWSSRARARAGRSRVGGPGRMLRCLRGRHHRSHAKKSCPTWGSFFETNSGLCQDQRISTRADVSSCRELRDVVSSVTVTTIGLSPAPKRSGVRRKSSV